MGKKAKKAAEPAEDAGEVDANLDLGDLAELSKKAGNLPKRIEECLYDPRSKAWIIPKFAEELLTKARRATLLRGYTHLVEKAKSGQSLCRRCGEKIAKDTLRMGYPSKDQRGEFGALPIYLHVKCARHDACVVAVVKKGDSAVRSKFLGYDALKKEERLQLCQELLAQDEEEKEPEAPPAVPAARNLAPHPKPDTLRVPMLPFQAEGLGWMLAREDDETTRGGILADEMGMGKTLQMISVLLAGKSNGPNLVVLPAAAMLQWRNEIQRFAEPGALEVELYYGFDRRKQDFSGRDRLVVLTTYQTMEADYRIEMNKHKVACQWCNRLFLPEKLKYHLKYYCGPDAQRTEKQQKSMRNDDLKNQAVKRMKIGGTETEITLNPLNAIRSAATANLRKRAQTPTEKGGAKSGKLQQGLPFPASVLPDEAREALTAPADGAAVKEVSSTPPAGLEVAFSDAGLPKRVCFLRRPLGIVCDQRNPREVISVKEGGHASELGVQCGWVMVSAGGQDLEGKTADEVNMTVGMLVSALPDAPATPPPQKRGRGRGRGCGRGARKGVKEEQAQEVTPPPPTPQRKRWGKDWLQPQNGSARAEEKGGAEVKKGCGWGLSLKPPTRQGSTISLDSEGSGSDLELVGAVCSVPGGSSSSTAPEPPVPPPPAPWQPPKEEESAAPEEGLLGADGLPPKPESDDEEEEGVPRRIDLSRSPLFSTRWGRVVLDEAHRIKGRTNSTAQAAFELKATSRWCLSGTPLQNRVGEVYSIIRFLRFYPYAHYLCSKRGCACASLHYRFDENSACVKCGHTKMMHRSHFANTVSNPIKRFGFVGAGRAAMECLRSQVLDKILLRRTKQERHSDLQLPPMEIKIRQDTLSPEENDFYQAMFTNSLTEFGTYVDKGTILHNYAHVFDLIMRLRQAVDHPYLIVHGSLRTASGPIPTKSRSEVATPVCALCQDDIDEPGTKVISQCGHAFHRDCVAEYLGQAPMLASGGIGCPTCFAPLTVNLDEEEAEEEAPAPVPAPEKPVGEKGSSGKVTDIMQRIKTAEFKSSTKIEALMQEVTRMVERDGSSKALVFSQFTTFLELIEWRMKREGISCAKLLGSMPVASKNNMIISFQTDPSLKVLLISLKAGGEGLNLQAADHIFLMDPWWNPAAELQAIQRAHRIGQTRPVYATRFVAKNTIEEKMVELQQKKQSVFDCSVGNSNSALQRLTSDDIKFLFSQ